MATDESGLTEMNTHGVSMYPFFYAASMLDVVKLIQ